MLKLTLVGGVLMAGVGVLAAQPSAHTWYPPDCLSVDYCGPIENAVWVSPGRGSPPQLAISSNYRTAVVQRAFTTGKSEDGRMHVCMRYDPFGALEVTCLLLPEPAF
ncbi:MAG: hypothetical protein IT539_06480 [Bradyrhizobiaceae bacterium]|nr:hypothetical protein [Bradyrhizobiaceae bacterium]